LCRVIVLEDNDVLHIVGGGYGIYNTAQADVETAVPRRLQLLEVEVDQIMKVGDNCIATHTAGAAAALASIIMNTPVRLNQTTVVVNTFLTHELVRLCRVLHVCLPQGGYDHYMQKEIHEQPESILQSMRGRVNIQQKEVSPGVNSTHP
jgi:glucosamine--fructose-6-phosphate aminotransferase (isomerizing)